MLSRKVLLRALACALLALMPFPDLDNQLYDFKVKLLSRTQFIRPSNVVLLEITRDDFDLLRRRFGSPAPGADGGLGEELGPWREKFEALRTQFFWDDRVYEGLLRKLLAAQPKKLLVTFFYGDNLVLLQNNSDLRRLARQPEVLWASQFDLEGRLEKPAPELTGTENYGFTNVSPDVDGVVRRAYLVQKNHVSLPFRALLDGPDTLKRSLPLEEPFLVRYAGPPGFVPTCTVSDFLDTSRCGDLRGKYVILSPSGNIVAGATLYRTPVGYMSRGEVLANVLLNARDDGGYVPVGKNILFIFVFAHCLLMALIVLGQAGRRQALSISALLASESLVILLLMRALSLQVPGIPFALATVASFTAFMAMSFAQQESKRWQAEKKAQYLRELDELKGNFLSLMSHDLKTPIAKVQALTERLDREARTLTADQREILGAIQRSNDELSQYILSILNFQRIESQELKLNKKNHDINQTIEEVIQRLQPLAHDRGVHMRLDLEPMFPVEFDEQLIRQVLNNLVDNSIKYNQAGTNVVVSSRDLGAQVEVCVEDDGIGIAPKQMERLFKKFSRAEKGTSERVKGTGLGLYLAKYFIERHGGEISASSEPGKGTKFRFRLPN